MTTILAPLVLVPEVLERHLLHLGAETTTTYHRGSRRLGETLVHLEQMQQQLRLRGLLFHRAMALELERISLVELQRAMLQRALTLEFLRRQCALAREAVQTSLLTPLRLLWLAAE